MLAKAFKKQANICEKTETINKKEDKRNNLLKTITKRDKIYLPKEQVEQYAGMLLKYVETKNEA